MSLSHIANAAQSKIVVTSTVAVEDVDMVFVDGDKGRVIAEAVVRPALSLLARPLLRTPAFQFYSGTHLPANK
jgi:hypothetical protein